MFERKKTITEKPWQNILHDKKFRHSKIFDLKGLKGLKG